MNKVLSIKDLIEKKGIIEEKRNEFLLIDVKDLGTFKFRKPTTEEVETSYRQEKGGEELLIQTCSVEPNLADLELRKEFGMEERENPIKIVKKIFNYGQIQGIAGKLLESAGLKEEEVKVVDEVKN